MIEREELEKLLNTLLQFTESTWLEFKCNNAKPDEMGEYISALANSAALQSEIMHTLCGELMMYHMR